MPLLDLKTDLTSLKYGNDRPGGGSSKQPFIVKDIPGKDKSFSDQIEDERTGLYGMSVGNDFGLRNALLNAAINGGNPLEDNKRIIDLYTKTRAGLVFEAKQVALGLLASPMAVWNPLAINAQELANVVGFGHVPSFINPDVKNFLSTQFPNANSLFGYRNSTAEGQSREDFYGMGNPAYDTNNLFKGKLGKNTKRDNYTLGITDKNSAPLDSSITGDKLSLQRLYTSEPNNTTTIGLQDTDMIKFVISVVNNDNPAERTWIHFRAYIDSFSDSYGAQWSDTKYVGRGESFYNYGGFSRDISLGFRVAVQSKAEQYPLYEKLTYLASICAPDYSKEGFMRGNLIYLTVGDYLVDVPGVLKGISFSGFEESPWEIGRDTDGKIDETIAQLPHSLQVSGFSFSPIHNFVPRRGAKFIGYDNPLGGIQTDLIEVPNIASNDDIAREERRQEIARQRQLKAQYEKLESQKLKATTPSLEKPAFPGFITLTP